jgi:triacylglycerol lipase
MIVVALLSSLLATFDGPPAVATHGHPVILVHGIFSNSRDMTRMARHFRAQGREVFTPNLSPARGEVGLEELARQLAAFADAKVPHGKFDLVGFSMGGLVSRYYVQRLGGVNRVEHLVTIAAPHHGTATAHLNARPGARQMRPGSEFLRDLSRDAATLSRIKFTSFYTPLDLVILPARSSEMAQASNVRIWAAIHPSLILEKRCIRAVAKTLGE